MASPERLRRQSSVSQEKGKEKGGKSKAESRAAAAAPVSAQAEESKEASKTKKKATKAKAEEIAMRATLQRILEGTPAEVGFGGRVVTGLRAVHEDGSTLDSGAIASFATHAQTTTRHV